VKKEHTKRKTRVMRKSYTYKIHDTAFYAICNRISSA
jgi:hypothetical protein